MDKINKPRESNIELLRVVLMVMIITIHYLVRGGFNLTSLGIGQYTFDPNSRYYLLLFVFVIASVNCFVFISGYFSIKLKKDNLIAFLLQALFYSIISLLMAHLLFPEKNIPHSNIPETLLPISSNHWWFLNIYLGLCLLSPIINKGIEYLTKNQFKFILIALIYLQTSYLLVGTNYLSTTGHSIYSMLVMYLLGRYFRLYNVEIRKPFVLFVVFNSILFLAFYAVAKFADQKTAWRMLTYNSLFIIISSISLFYSFKNIKVKYSPFINRMAALSFGVYLLHESESMKIVIAKIPRYLSTYTSSGLITILLLVFVAIFTFFAGALIERLRVLAFQPLSNFISALVKTSDKSL